MNRHSSSSHRVFKAAASALAVSLVVLAGCSVESEDASEEEVIDSTASALSPGCGLATIYPDCPSSANGQKSHAEATRMLRYIFGDDSAVPRSGPNGFSNSCNKATALPLVIRARIAAGTVSIARTTGNVCGRSSVIYTLRPNNGVPISNPNELTSYDGWLTSCNGWEGTGAFSLVDAVVTSGSSCTASEVNQNSFVKLDPEAATLTANLTSSTSGATAAAVGSDTGEPTKVIRWGSSYSSCGSYASYAGSPCTTTAVNAGSTVYGRLIKKGTLCACL